MRNHERINLKKIIIKNHGDMAVWCKKSKKVAIVFWLEGNPIIFEKDSVKFKELTYPVAAYLIKTGLIYKYSNLRQNSRDSKVDGKTLVKVAQLIYEIYYPRSEERNLGRCVILKNQGSLIIKKVPKDWTSLKMAEYMGMSFVFEYENLNYLDYAKIKRKHRNIVFFPKLPRIFETSKQDFSKENENEEL